MSARAVTIVVTIALVSLVGGFLLGQQSLRSTSMLSNDRLDSLLAARFGATSSVSSVMSPASSSVLVNGTDRTSVVRVARSSVVQVLDLCDPRARAAVSHSLLYRPSSFARFCAERTSAK